MGQCDSLVCHVKPRGLSSEHRREQVKILHAQDTNSCTSMWLLYLLCRRELQPEGGRGEGDQGRPSTMRNARKEVERRGDTQAHLEHFIQQVFRREVITLLLRHQHSA